jgi:hypothetical protein
MAPESRAEPTAEPAPGRLGRVSFTIGLVNLALTAAGATAAFLAGYPLRPSYLDPWITIGAAGWMLTFITAEVGAGVVAAGFVALAQRQAPRSSAVAAVVTGLMPPLFVLVASFIVPYAAGAL